MLFSMYIIKDRRARIAGLLKSIKDEQEELDTEKGRFNGYVYDIMLALKEFKICCKDNRYEYILERLSLSLVNIRNSIDGITIKGHIDAIVNILNEINTDIEPNSWYGNFSKISQRLIQNLMPHINNNNRNFTIFDSECLDGYLLNQAKELNKNALTYGLEENNYRAEEAKKNATKIIKGHLKGSRISNDVFDMVICLGHIKTTLQDNMSIGSIAKVEKYHIINMLKYLRLNGIFILAIPYYRMHKDICTLLSKQLENVSIIKGFEEDEDKGLIYIIGQKCKSGDIDEEIYESLRKCYNYDNVKYMHEIQLCTYTLPGMTREIEIFKGSVIDMDELLNIVKTSGCIDAFFEKQKVKKIHENTIRPLLPFNVGQIGLVLTSGCLDGIINEGDDHYHLVKGRVSKKKDVVRTVSNGVVQESETISNRVEINVILPNGDFKTLA